MYEYHNKMERIDTISSPRLILVGGSNLAFSIDSEMISDSLKFNIVNMGLHASTGLRYMLDSLFPYLKENDIIVIMPEYSQFYTQYNGRFETLSPAFFFTPNKDVSMLNFEQISNVISGIPSHIKSNLLFRNSNQWQYSSDNFNEYGDEIAHRKEPSKNYAKPTAITSSLNKYAIEDLANKISNIKKKGCEVYLFWPITIESNYLVNHAAIQEISENLKQKDLHFSIDPDYFVQPDSMAYDTPDHLNGKAAEESARRFIKAARIISMGDN